MAGDSTTRCRAGWYLTSGDAFVLPERFPDRMTAEVKRAEVLAAWCLDLVGDLSPGRTAARRIAAVRSSFGYSVTAEGGRYFVPCEAHPGLSPPAGDTRATAEGRPGLADCICPDVGAVRTDPASPEAAVPAGPYPG